MKHGLGIRRLGADLAPQSAVRVLRVGFVVELGPEGDIVALACVVNEDVCTANALGFDPARF